MIPLAEVEVNDEAAETNEKLVEKLLELTTSTRCTGESGAVDGTARVSYQLYHLRGNLALVQLVVGAIDRISRRARPKRTSVADSAAIDLECPRREN